MNPAMRFAARGAACGWLTSLLLIVPATARADEAWTPLFNGKDFTGWKVPEGDNGHWRVVDGVIDEPTIGIDTPEDYRRFVGGAK